MPASSSSCSATGPTRRLPSAPLPNPSDRPRAPRSKTMPSYTPPLRDMQFVIHEVLNVAEELKACPRHADLDADTMNAVLEEGGKFASEVAFPLNRIGDEE